MFSPLTFSANHSHCKTSAIKHWPAGDKEPSHLAGGAPYVTSPSYKQPVMALLPYTSPSYLSACKPRSGKTTCRNNDKTIRGIECNDCPADTGYGCWSNNKLWASCVLYFFFFFPSRSERNPGPVLCKVCITSVFLVTPSQLGTQLWKPARCDVPKGTDTSSRFVTTLTPPNVFICSPRPPHTYLI